jgi:hypothetical protein
MRKKYQVFVSSTYKDLVDVRKHVMNTILKAGCIPAGMELFPPTSEAQWKVITSVIDESDYYVLVVAGKYGSEFRGKSYTQREFEYAIQKKKKIIALLYKNIEKLDGGSLEKTDDKRKKLENFRALILKNGLTGFWENKDELCGELRHGLEDLKEKFPADGWIKGSRANLRKLSENRNKNLIKQNTALKDRVSDLEAKIAECDEISQIPNGNSLKKLIADKIEEIDEKISQYFPEKMRSGKLNQDVRFTSSKLINSLTSMGIPIDVCVEVLDLALPELLSLKRQVPQLTTSHIRMAISNALYKIEISQYSDNQIQLWGDAYVRKYGNPQRRISVIMDHNPLDVKFEFLSYRFLKEILIPDLIMDVYGNINPRNFLKEQRSKEDARIAEEIISFVKKMNVYRIHYSNLLSLSKEIALQPPHPWLVQKAFEPEAIQYEYDRSLSHAKIIFEGINKGELSNKASYSLKECVHHSSAGILATYGVYMGCGYMAPFFNLHHHIGDFVAGFDSESIGYSMFNKFPGDLMDVGTSISDFTELVNSIRKALRESKAEDVFTIQQYKDVLQLFEVFESIVKLYKYDESF